MYDMKTAEGRKGRIEKGRGAQEMAKTSTLAMAI
jgi:hypothetical protein